MPTTRGPPGWMQAIVVFVGPAGHQVFGVAVLQRLVEGVFGVVGGAANNGGLKFGFGHGGRLGVQRLIVPRMRSRPLCINPA